MADTTFNAEQIYYKSYDIERGLRLSRFVGVAFGSILFVATIIVVLIGWLKVTTIPIEISRFFPLYPLYVGFQAAGIWLSWQRYAIASALIILIGMILTFLTIQLSWASIYGLDAITVICLSAYCLTVGLAGVMANTTTMFVTTGVATLIDIGISLNLFQLNPHIEGRRITVAAIAIIIQWVIAFFIFISSKLYVQTLDELGSIRIAYDRAQKLEELREQFITNVNHELRNPIMAMYNYLEIVRLSGENIDAPRRAEMLNQAVQVGDRVLYLLNGILDSRKQVNNLDHIPKESVSLRMVIQNALLIAIPASEVSQRHIKFQVSDELYVQGSALHIEQVFINLLTNSVKYSDPGTPIEILATVVPPSRFVSSSVNRSRKMSSSTIQINVRDYGQGIPSEYRGLLFERFVRLPRDLASQISGNGLGLFICRLFLESMGGSISVKSSGIPGQGSIFTVQLLVSPAPNNP
jgi:signal transduction histidine kinase